jgi:hypothetical protein
VGWTTAKRAAFEPIEEVVRAKRAGTIARMSAGAGRPSREDLSHDESIDSPPCAPSIVHMSLWQQLMGTGQWHATRVTIPVASGPALPDRSAPSSKTATATRLTAASEASFTCDISKSPPYQDAARHGPLDP